mgnify:CR=1 FL=1
MRLNRTGGHKEKELPLHEYFAKGVSFIQYIQKSQPYGSLSCYNFHRVRGMKQIIFIFAMLMTCLSYADKPEGRSERRTDMKPMKEIYLAGGCFWGTEHFSETNRRGRNYPGGICKRKYSQPYLSTGVHRYYKLAETVKVQYDPDKADLPFLSTFTSKQLTLPV